MTGIPTPPAAAAPVTVRLPTPESLFAARLAAEPSSPLLTFYDDATGERAELSAKSLGNWVAKTHFLLLDELGLGPGSRAYVAMPVHWLAAPILLGCWFAGLEVVTDPRSADVAFGAAESLAGANLDTVDEVYAVSLLSMARSAEPPPRMADYAASVRPHPDAWATVSAQALPGEPALDGRSRADLAAAAVARASELGLQHAGRLLWTEPDFGPDAWLSALLAPLAAGGSVVLVRHADPQRRPATITAERVTTAH